MPPVPSPSLDSVEAGAPEHENDVTPAMIKAGVVAFAGTNFDMDSFEEIVLAVYVAMESAKPQGFSRAAPCAGDGGKD
jgi:hypothetical protein